MLVIGSNSFSGASFVAHALKQGWQVTGVSRSPEPDRCYLPYSWGDLSQNGFAFHQLDLKSDSKQIFDLVSENRIPYVVNFAALGMVAESWQYPTDYYATNTVGNVALHEALRKCNCLERYIHVSTPEVYGDTEGSVTEDALLNPTTPYAASRAACDMHLKTFHAQYGFPVLWTRAANVYGPGQQPFRIIPRAILCARLGMKLQLHGGGSSVRSFIHIEDVASATLEIMRNGKIGSTYHVSTNRYLSIRELAEMVAVRAGVKLSDIAEDAPERAGKDQAYYLDSSLCRTELGWNDRVSLENGIDETITWIDDNIETFKRIPLEYVHKA